MFHPIYLSIFILLCTIAMAAAADQTLLTPAGVLQAEQASHLSRYVCPDSRRCTVQCAAGEGHLSLERSGVRRLEVASGDHRRVITAVFVDAVGKAHSSQAILPEPSSCQLDNLEHIDTLTVDEGTVSLPAEGSQEVIFDLRPGSE